MKEGGKSQAASCREKQLPGTRNTGPEIEMKKRKGVRVLL